MYAQRLRRMGGLTQLLVGKVGNRPARGNPHRLGQHPAKAVVEDSREQLRDGKVCCSATFQLRYQGVLRHIRQKIQPAKPLAAALTRIPGHLENHRPAETVLGKLQLPRAFGKPLSVV